jgi:hypothetical protein
VQERRPPAEIREFLTPAVPDRLGDIAGNKVRIAEAQRVCRRRIARVERVIVSDIRHRVVVVVFFVESPHTATLSE